MKKNTLLIAAGVLTALAASAAVGAHVLNKREEQDKEFTNEETNRQLGKEATVYEKYVKRGMDVSIAFVGVVLTAPIVAASSLAIYKEDPGNVIFKQKRVGINKSHFNIHKLRSMKQNTGDIPTHLLSKETQDNMILKVGRFIRKTSIDELPQFVDILRGRMSLVGPRPALWNQDDLIAEREKYGVNDVRPGLTGWAQINGRDSISIEDKALLDKVYRDALREENLSGFMMDCKCFFGTIKSVLSSDGVVEGGTGSMSTCDKEARRHYTDSKTDSDLIGNIGFGEKVEIDNSAKKKVLITGAGSYIGQSFIDYVHQHYTDNFDIDELDMIDGIWREKDFSKYDIVYHVAGIAHADVGNVSEEIKQKYYEVNTDLTVEVAEKAKASGVKEFVFMSSMIVYGDSAPYGKKKVVTEKTVPMPANFYGDSKLQADVAVRDMANDKFKVIVLRPPMIYGRGSKGNYPTLAKLAKKLPIFPDVDNQRSMLYIENLCEFLCQLMLVKEIRNNAIVLIPQNAEWTKTSDMVKEIAKVSDAKIKTMGILKPAVSAGGVMPGKIGGLVNKAFGNSCYAHEMSEYAGMDYQKISLKESIVRTEGGAQVKNAMKTIWIIDHYSSEPQYGGISRQYDFARQLAKMNYNVVVIASGFSHFTHTYISEQSVFVSEVDTNVHYVYLKTSEYQTNGGIGRAKNMMDFMGKVLKYEKLIADKYGKPDVVNGCSVHPLAWVAAGKVARKYNVRFCVEVRDFWPRIWVVSGEKRSFDPMVVFFDKIQTWAFKHADRIIYSMYHGDKYICNELGYNSKKTFLIGQPMDCERFDSNKVKLENLPEDIREFIKDGFICSFAGYYMTYEGVYVMLEAAKILSEKGIPVKMVFVGSGQEKDGMVEYVRRHNLDNVMIYDRIAKEAVPVLLYNSQVCMAHLEVEGHKDVYKYGVSKNKVNEYLYSGACTLYGFLHKDDAVAISGGGLMFEPYDANDLANKIEYVFSLSNEERAKYGILAREYVKNNYSVEILSRKLEQVLFS